MITVFNKIDKEEEIDISYNIDEPKVFISAKNNINLDLLLKQIEDNLPKKYYKVDLLIPYNLSNISSHLFDKTNVEKTEYVQDGTVITTVLDEIDYERYKKYIIQKGD